MSASKTSSPAQRSPREMIVYALTKAVSGLAGLLAAIVVTRSLGADAYGFYSTSWFLVLTCSTLGFSWLGQCILRFGVASLRQSGAALPQRALIGSAIVTALSAALGAFLSFRASGSFSLTTGLLIAGAAVCIGLLSTSQFVFQSQFRPGSILRTEIVKFSLLLLLPMLLAMTWHGQVFLALGICLAALGALLCALRPLRLLLGLAHDDAPLASALAEANSLRSYFAYGISLTLFSAGMTGLPVIERFFLLNFFGATRAGEYIGVYDIVVRGFTVGLMPVTLALHPRIMQAHNAGDFTRSNRLIQTGLSIQLALAALGTLGVLLVSPVLFRILKISEPFSWPLLLTLCASGAAWQIALIVQKPLERGNQTHVVLASFAVSLLLILCLDGFLPRYYGRAGIALGNLAGASLYIALVAVMGAYSSRTRVAPVALSEAA